MRIGSGRWRTGREIGWMGFIGREIQVRVAALTAAVLLFVEGLDVEAVISLLSSGRHHPLSYFGRWRTF
jgi:hypothetical protein